MNANFSLLFRRDPNDLPGPLPEISEIHEAPVLYPSSHADDERTVLVRGMFVVKYGEYVTANEGHALVFIEENLQAFVPAPRLYSMYRQEGALYLVMSYIPGTALDDLWPILSEQEKASMMNQLGSSLNHMRSLGTPGLYGSVHGGPIPSPYFRSRDHLRDASPHPLDRRHDITGPFHTEEEFNLALVRHARAVQTNAAEWEPNYLARHISTVLRDHDIRFTHGNLNRKNIIVRPVNNPTSDGGQFEVVGIIDWRAAGWYPSYWEYICIFPHDYYDDEWAINVEKILHPWPMEAAVFAVVNAALFWEGWW